MSTCTGRAALVGEFLDVRPAEMGALWRGLAERFGHVTVIALADPRSFGTQVVTAAFLGLSVVVVPDAAMQAGGEPARGARQVVALAPDGVGVDHLVLTSWSQVRRHLARGGYEDVVFVDRLPRFRDRLLARFAAYRPAGAPSGG
jgi:hypothetical protein